jgi:hypothetical protein
LYSPEELEPASDLWRTSASVTYNRAFSKGAWQTTLAWGRNDHMVPRGAHQHEGEPPPQDPDPQDAFLLESALRVRRHTFFMRGEAVEKDHLFETGSLAHTVFDVARTDMGYLFEPVRTKHTAWGVGGFVSFVALPETLRETYGGQPVSFVLFARARLR